MTEFDLSVFPPEIDSESTSGYAGTSGQKYALWPGFFTGVSVGTNGSVSTNTPLITCPRRSSIPAH
jgi:hypothetical protein